jgi:hypothetical protein
MIGSLSSELHRSGFDICHPINTSWYNKLIQSEGLIESGALKRLPESSSSVVFVDNNDSKEGKEDPGTINCCNAILIGNTKHVWPFFIKWFADYEKKWSNEGGISRLTNPFDDFVEEQIVCALERCLSSSSKPNELDRGRIGSYELFRSDGRRTMIVINDDGTVSYYPHEESFLVSMTRVATTTGKYWNDNEATMLCVHPEYGTWTAFRAVVVFTSRGDDRSTLSSSPLIAPPLCPRPVSDEEMKIAKSVFNYALNGDTENGYGSTVGKEWDELCEYLQGSVIPGSSWEKVPETMKPWIKLRDCIGIGREKWKYDEPQLLYHYTKDREILNMELRRFHDEQRHA